MSSWLEFLQSRGARVVDGRVADFGDKARELAAARDATVVADLSPNALIAVSGDDATAFLHGQLTNDVEALPVDSAHWTGWCTPKGRLLASFLLVRRSTGYLIVLPAEIAPSIQKRLSMYVLRSKVKLEDVSAQYARMGVAGPAAGETVARRFGKEVNSLRVVEAQDGSIAIALGLSRFLVLSPVETAHAMWETFAAAATPAGTDAWDWTSIHAGIPIVLAATQEAFVPQMANFDLIGAVSFKKGCYPGQEIVARMQYRGGLKRRMALAHMGGDVAPAPGESVYSESFGDQAAGTIANAAPSPDGGFDALIVAQLESLDRGDLHWKSPQGPPLTILSRPQADAAT
jgi:hypothetical protein